MTSGQNTSKIGVPGAPRRGRGLAHALVDDFTARIGAATLRAGDRLPTESTLMVEYGVSRTVVREAISRLQAAGLVETRHGIGTFVLAQSPTSVFRLEAADVATSVDVLAVLELRISLETECAGLAAVRRTPSQLAEMREVLRNFERGVGAGNDTVPTDFQFHLLIAQATGNPYFFDIMNHLGTRLIPRMRIAALRQPVGQEEYLARVNREHQEIVAAIERKDAESARAAMRVHLTNSRERLRRAQEAARSGDFQDGPDVRGA